jgi:hypothetical protein
MKFYKEFSKDISDNTIDNTTEKYIGKEHLFLLSFQCNQFFKKIHVSAVVFNDIYIYSGDDHQDIYGCSYNETANQQNVALKSVFFFKFVWLIVPNLYDDTGNDTADKMSNNTAGNESN